MSTLFRFGIRGDVQKVVVLGGGKLLSACTESQLDSLSFLNNYKQ